MNDILGSLLNADKIKAPDGSTWWSASVTPPGAKGNERATRFLAKLTGVFVTLYGTVLYLSPEETKRFEGSLDPMVPIRGKTYDVREKLKTIGARWNRDNKVWMIQKSKLPMAEDIVRKG